MAETIMWCALCGFIGAFIGVALMACCNAAGQADYHAALARKDAQINTLCSRIKLLSGDGTAYCGECEREARTDEQTQ